MVLFSFWACNIMTGIDTGEDSGNGAETEEIVFPPVADIDWTNEGIVLTISNGEGRDFQFGLVESTDACSIDNDFGCWTGENCDATTGYVSIDEETSLGPFCHGAGTLGVQLAYSSGLSAIMGGIEYVTQGQQTAFPAPNEENSYEFKVTYILEDNVSGDCWVWGVDPDYFEAKSCKYPIPVSRTDAFPQQRAKHPRSHRVLLGKQ